MATTAKILPISSGSTFLVHWDLLYKNLYVLYTHRGGPKGAPPSYYLITTVITELSCSAADRYMTHPFLPTAMMK